jgi:hypothetical protein
MLQVILSKYTGCFSFVKIREVIDPAGAAQAHHLRRLIYGRLKLYF